MRQPLIAGLALLTFASMFSAVSTQASASAWCDRWQEVCLRTGGVPSICQSRLAQCNSDPKKCYFFNNPGPRCHGEELAPVRGAAQR